MSYNNFNIICNMKIFSYSKKGFKVRSFGSGNQVKLPGPAPDKPNIYDFGVSYEQMYQDLLNKDKALYPLYVIYFILFILRWFT